MTIVNDILKWLGQYPSSKHALAIQITFLKHALTLMICLRWPHNNLSDLEDKESQQLPIACVNSSSENFGHIKDEKESSSFKIILSTVRNWAELKDKWRACQKMSSSKHRLPLCFIISITGSLYLLTQFISSHRPCFWLAISWIFKSKNSLFVLLTVL